MPNIADLEPLLSAPVEALDVEYKDWLDLHNNDEHRAVLAKAAIALANEGGGNIVIGIREERPNLVSQMRPAAIAAYDQDLINDIIRRFASPAFHCTLTTLRHPRTESDHAVITVPGGFSSPVMSKSGTPGNTIRPHVIYMRKPGPESAPPTNIEDWDRLLSKCLRNRREDMLDAIRAIVEGKITTAPAETEAQSQKVFADGARARWTSLTAGLDVTAPQRCPLGRCEFDYALLGEFDRPSIAEFRDMLRDSVQRCTGWPEFWLPDHREIEPVPFDDGIDCWIGAPYPDRFHTDPAHVDFWRASPRGRLFLLRGYAEDIPGIAPQRGIEPGTTFDITVPTLRVGECLLHAAALSARIAPGRPLRALFRMHWYGLAGRRLASVGGGRLMLGDYICQQAGYSGEATFDIERIGDNLPELVYPLMAPLYERFGFFRLPQTLVIEELARMRANRF